MGQRHRPRCFTSGELAELERVLIHLSVLRDTYTIQSGYQVAVQDDSDDFEQFAQDISFEDYYQQLHDFQREQRNVKLLERFKTFFQSNLAQNDAIVFIACGGLW